MTKKQVFYYLDKMINQIANEKNSENLKLLQDCNDLISKYLQGFNVTNEAHKLYLKIGKQLKK